MSSQPHSPRQIQLTALLAGLCLVIGACGNSDGNDGASGKEPLHIGVETGLTGANATDGAAQLAGMKAYIAMVNAGGGINGHQVVLDTADDGNNPANAPGAARKLVETEKVLVLTNTISATSAAILPYLKARKVLLIPSSGSTALISDPQSTVRLVRTGYAGLAAQIVEYGVKNLNVKRVAIAYTPDAIGEPARDGALAELKALGLEPVAVVQYSSTAANTSAQAAQLKAANPDFVVVNNISSAVAPLIKAADQIGFKPIWGSTTAMVGSGTVATLADQLDGRSYFSTSSVLPDSPDATLYQTWMGKTGGDTTLYPSMDGWNIATGAIAVLRRAMAAAGGKVPTPEQVLNAADGTTINDAYTHNLAWTGTNFNGPTGAQVITLKDRKFKQVQAFQNVPTVS